jgi:hypothetical protein
MAAIRLGSRIHMVANSHHGEFIFVDQDAGPIAIRQGEDSLSTR